MHAWPWRMMLVLGLAVAFLYAATRNDPELRLVEHASTTQLIERLDHAREPVRRAAASQLVSAGTAAVPDLLAGLPYATEQQQAGIFLVLEDLYLSKDDEVFDVVVTALNSLSDSDRSDLSHQADQILRLNTARRNARAYAKIAAAGGKFVTTYPSAKPESEQQGDLLLLDETWSGGPAEWGFIRHIRHLTAVHLTQAAGLSDAEIERLREAMPYTIFRRERESCLGIVCYQDARTLEVARVVPNSPAERCGLKRLDEIVELNGASIGNAVEFFEELRRYPVGENVQLLVLRNGRELTLPVTLGDDFSTGRCRCLDDVEVPTQPSPPAFSSVANRLQHPTDRIIGPAVRGIFRKR
ncbi:MAG: PDZ domain-containing protein [Planctomycetaceae bacterium]